MALAYTVDNLDTVPEALRGEYVEQDGKFRLNVEGVPDALNLKKALATERELNRAVKKSGRTPQEVDQIFGAADSIVAKSAELDRLIEQLSTRITTERAAIDADKAALSATETLVLRDATLAAALYRAGANAAGRDLLPDVLRDRVRLETKDGKRVAVILEDDEQTPMAGTGKNGAATWSDLTREARKKYPSMFDPE